MKIIMYHYVREKTKGLPFLRYLSFKNFCKQLDFFEKNFGFVKYENFINLKKDMNHFKELKDKILLTFDDGLIDHYNFVFFELLKRNLFGLFFIPTRILHQKKALDVHRIHYLLGRYGGGVLNQFVLDLIDNTLLDNSFNNIFDTYYKEHNDDLEVKKFKALFNLYIKYEFREQILDEVVKHFCSDDEIFNALYLNEKHLEKMQANKMIIGAHSFNHLNFLKLNKEEQFEEVNKSFKTLDRFLNPLKTFCYPYGEFNVDSKEILEILNCDFAFVSLDYYKKDITLEDLKNNPYTLSRYDCNEFQFGQAN